MEDRTFHPVADVFPLMQGEEFVAFCADVKAHGLRLPIVLHPDGSILDGRNRYRACIATGIDPKYILWGGPPGTEVAYVLSLNLARRHLNESQRAMVAARLATMGEGRPKETAPIGAVSQPEAADLLNIARRSVQRARVVLDDGTPELIAAVEQGHIAVSQAAKVALKPAPTQDKVVKRVMDGVRPTEATRQVRAAEIEERRIEQPTGKYRVLYADPSWSYGNTMPDSGTEQRDHYPVMAMEDICALPVKAMAEDDAVLFLWVTSPMLEEAFQVVHAWGFSYKASMVWHKLAHNMGHYVSVRHEFLLICTRGACRPDSNKLLPSVVEIKRGEHSVKPEEFRTMIDEMYPVGKRIELFARTAHEGWDNWGLEAPQ